MKNVINELKNIEHELDAAYSRGKSVVNDIATLVDKLSSAINNEEVPSWPSDDLYVKDAVETLLHTLPPPKSMRQVNMEHSLRKFSTACAAKPLLTLDDITNYINSALLT